MLAVAILVLLFWEPFILWLVAEAFLILVFMYILIRVLNLNTFILVFSVEVLASLSFITFYATGLYLMGVMFLVLKFGFLPFWFWVIRVFEDFFIKSVVVLFSLYKIFPISWVLVELGLGQVELVVVILNLFAGLIRILVLFDLRKVLGYLSIFSTSWILLARSRIYLLIFYGIVYFIVLSFLFYSASNKSVKSVFFLCILLYLGFPPLPIFLLKVWLITKIISIRVVSVIFLWSVLIVVGLFVVLYRWVSLKRFLFWIRSYTILLPLILT